MTGYVFLLVTTFCIGFAIAIIGPLLSGFIKEEFSEYSSILVGVYSFAMGVGSLIVSSFTKAITISVNWKFGLGIWGDFDDNCCCDLANIFSKRRTLNYRRGKSGKNCFK